MPPPRAGTIHRNILWTRASRGSETVCRMEPPRPSRTARGPRPDHRQLPGPRPARHPHRSAPTPAASRTAAATPTRPACTAPTPMDPQDKRQDHHPPPHPRRARRLPAPVRQRPPPRPHHRTPGTHPGHRRHRPPESGNQPRPRCGHARLTRGQIPRHTPTRSSRPNVNTSPTSLDVFEQISEDFQSSQIAPVCPRS